MKEPNLIEADELLCFEDYERIPSKPRKRFNLRIDRYVEAVTLKGVIEIILTWNGKEHVLRRKYSLSKRKRRIYEALEYAEIHQSELI